MTPDARVYSFWLPAALGEALAGRAEAAGVTRNRLVRDVLTEYVETDESPPDTDP